MTNMRSVAEVVAGLEGVDVESATVAELATLASRLGRVRGFVAAFEARVARRADELHRCEGALPADEVLAGRGRRSRRDAARAGRRARTLADTPELEGALEGGRVGVEHADVVADAARGLTEEQRCTLLGFDAELTDAAMSSTPEEFRRTVRGYVDQVTGDDGADRDRRQREATQVRLGVDQASGMGWIRGELHPEAYHRLKRALTGRSRVLATRGELAGWSRDRVTAHALVDLAAGSAADGGSSGGSGPARERPGAEIIVVTPLDTLLGVTGSPPAEYVDGASMPVAALRRHACDGGLVPVVLNGAGVPVDVGRRQRLATSEQRAALRAIYRTCAVAGCAVPFDDCEIHHLAEWTADLGPTDLANLVPCCTVDHHRAHEGGWRFALDPATRELTVRLPDGSLHSRNRPDGPVSGPQSERPPPASPHAA